MDTLTQYIPIRETMLVIAMGIAILIFLEWIKQTKEKEDNVQKERIFKEDKGHAKE